jgi:hypothetical protein
VAHVFSPYSLYSRLDETSAGLDVVAKRIFEASVRIQNPTLPYTNP